MLRCATRAGGFEAVLGRYDELYCKLKGKIGIHVAIDGYRDMLFDTISETFPWLREECDNQRRRILERGIVDNNQ